MNEEYSRAAIEHDPAAIEAMARKADLVDRAVAALRAGHRDRISPIMDRDFDLRRSVYDLPADQLRMVDVARRHGSHAEFAGSGGSAIGTYEDESHLAGSPPPTRTPASSWCPCASPATRDRWS